MDWYFNSRYRVKRLDFDLKRKLCQGLLTFRCLVESMGRRLHCKPQIAVVFFILWETNQKIGFDECEDLRPDGGYLKLLL